MENSFEATVEDFFESVAWGDIASINLFMENNEAIVNERNEDEQTPLHWAALHGQTEVCKLLLDHGAKVHAENAENKTAYEVAVTSSTKRFLKGEAAFRPRVDSYYDSHLHLSSSKNADHQSFTENTAVKIRKAISEDSMSQIDDSPNDTIEWYSIEYSINFEELLAYLPIIFDWLLLTETSIICDHLVFFAEDETMSSPEWIIIEYALRRFETKIKDLGINADVVLSEPQISAIRYTLDKFEGRIWAGCILKVFLSLESPLISESVKLQVLTLDKSHMSTKEDIKHLRYMLTEIRNGVVTTSHTILGEFCSFIHDVAHSKTKVKEVSRVLGPLLLMEESLNSSSTKSFSAPLIFTVMVDKCMSVFEHLVFHKNKKLYSTPKSGPGSKKKSPKIFHWTQYLIFFFALRDKKYLSIVDDLSRFHSFVHVATGIFFKYSMLPEGWKNELLRLQRSHSDNMKWLNGDEVIFLGVNRNKFPPIKKSAFYYEITNDPDSEIDKRVDEIIQNEKDFFNLMTTMRNTYVNEISHIAKGRVGVHAQESLGLTIKQIDQVFGETYDNVIRLSEKLLLRLEVFALVREPIYHARFRKLGRAGLISNIMIEVAIEMKRVYRSYFKHLQRSDNILKEAEDQLKNQFRRFDETSNTEYISNKGDHLPSSPKLGNAKRHSPYNNSKQGSKTSAHGYGNHSSEKGRPEFQEYERNTLNFLDIWEATSATKTVLKSRRITSILHQPVKRITNYMILLEKLTKVALKSGHKESHKQASLAAETYRNISRRLEFDLLTEQPESSSLGDPVLCRDSV